MLMFITVQFEKCLTSMACVEVLAEKKTLSLTKNMVAQLRFAQLHLNRLQDIWKMICTGERSEVEIFGQNTHLTHLTPNTSYLRPGTVVEG